MYWVTFERASIGLLKDIKMIITSRNGYEKKNYFFFPFNCNHQTLNSQFLLFINENITLSYMYTVNIDRRHIIMAIRALYCTNSILTDNIMRSPLTNREIDSHCVQVNVQLNIGERQFHEYTVFVASFTLETVVIT